MQDVLILYEFGNLRKASGELFDGFRSLGSAHLSPLEVRMAASDWSEFIGPAYSGDLGSNSCFSWKSEAKRPLLASPSIEFSIVVALAQTAAFHRCLEQDEPLS